jgi:regulator of replication initiation timing
MDILNLLKVKINNMKKIIVHLQNENESLRLELSNINNENSHLLQRSEDMLSSIDKTLSNIKYSKDNEIDISEIISSKYE